MSLTDKEIHLMLIRTLIMIDKLEEQEKIKRETLRKFCGLVCIFVAIVAFLFTG